MLLVGLCWISWSALASAELRSAKVAGTFYPDDPQELSALVHELLKKQPEPSSASKPRILIVPHAGYQYSGLVAANGFRHIQGHSYDGVVVVAFTHRMQFPGASVDTREAYETPLGVIPIDQEAVAILQTYPGVYHLEEAHESGEHSLEVELPFLQVVLPRLRIVPILMGSVDMNDARQLADALATLSRLGDYLFVFSTDLSHYHPHDEAQAIDERTIHAMLYETPEAVSQLFDRGDIEACGRGPIVTSLLLAERLGYLTHELLYAANSGDTWGDAAKVVGYAAIGMYPQPARATEHFSSRAGHALVRAARGMLEHSLAQHGSAPTLSIKQYPELANAQGIFVTLRNGSQLRGCIGRIQTTEPLTTMLPIVALDAALHDTRFLPVGAGELSQLTVEVSVLTPPHRIDRLDELVAGRDGVILELQGHSGVFLPQVWQETGWTRLEFLRELASQKAGLSPDAWQHAALSTFQAQVFEEPSTPHGAVAEDEGEPLPAESIAH